MAKDFSKFHALKDKYPDRILLFLNWDVYQAYGNDAKVCAKILNLELKTPEDSSMNFVEFSTWALDRYLKILIKAGKFIAICDSLEERKFISKRSIKDLTNGSEK